MDKSNAMKNIHGILKVIPDHKFTVDFDCDSSVIPMFISKSNRYFYTFLK